MDATERTQFRGQSVGFADADSHVLERASCILGR